MSTEKLNQNYSVGDVVISPKFGVGHVVGMESLSDVGTSFYVIETNNDKCRVLVPLSGRPQIRRPATKDIIEKSLEQIKTAENVVSAFPAFKSKRERVEFFKEVLKSIDLNTTVTAICELNDISNRGKVEDQILDGLIANYSIEVAEVTQRDNDEAKTLIYDLLEMRKA
ncbi:CarD-like protein [Bacteriovorax sp. BSW11_IV]|uniref:CarD family transcriptional regulator n=1 Tax=Bacteriovorax sp. BSW11_IV TaxID=1353529 RepID=UPI000389F2F4|nr:CarD family transcriptional regulator [Bacteriovorax sp. BSW11_IV]EQC48479.1 CarD-like protein [Bacteriovorax sp. BSW11_IV]